jgi:hypothetical protein
MPADMPRATVVVLNVCALLLARLSQFFPLPWEASDIDGIELLGDSSHAARHPLGQVIDLKRFTMRY